MPGTNWLIRKTHYPALTQLGEALLRRFRHHRDMRILIVEDDESSLYLAKRVVGHMGHSVLTASDGLQGLATARTEKPDLLLLDLRLPGIGGLDVVRAVRSDPALRTLPVIAVSANNSPEDREAALAAGCDDFVVKPYQPEDLRAAIQRRLPA